MTPRLRLFYDLRTKGFKFFDALRISEVDWISGLFYAACLIAILIMVNCIDSLWEEHANNRASAEKERANAEHRRAESNLRAFNHAMRGGSFLLEDGRALFTCPALESKI